MEILSKHLKPHLPKFLLFLPPIIWIAFALKAAPLLSIAITLVALGFWAFVCYLDISLEDPCFLNKSSKFIKKYSFYILITILIINPLLWKIPDFPKFLASSILLLIFLFLQLSALILISKIFSTNRVRVFQKCLAIIAIQLISFYVIFIDGTLYYADFVPEGVHRAFSFFQLLPMTWWLAVVVAPCILVAINQFIRSHEIFNSPWLVSSETKMARQTAVRSLWVFSITLISILAYLLGLDMILPGFGDIVFVGDESQYVKDARIFARGTSFLPPTMPLLPLWYGGIWFVFGEWAFLPSIANLGLFVASVPLLALAVRLLTKNHLVSIIAALLFVCTRSNYLYIWSSLTEPMNSVLFIVTFYSFARCYDKKSLGNFLLFGLCAAGLVMLRTQNGGGFGAFYLILIYFTIFDTSTRRFKLDAQVIKLFLCAIIPVTLIFILWGWYVQNQSGSFRVFDTRGGPIFVGMNSPGVAQGLDVTAWFPKYQAWAAQNPNATSFDMLSAGLKFRLDNPFETLTYVYWRTVELFHYRQFLWNRSLIQTLGNNFQFTVSLLAWFLAALFHRGRLFYMLTALLAFQLIPFIMIYTEARYRYPTDFAFIVILATFVTYLITGTKVILAEASQGNLSTSSLRSGLSSIVLNKKSLLAVFVFLLLVVGVFTAREHLGKFYNPGHLVPRGSVIVDTAPDIPLDNRKVYKWSDLVTKVERPEDFQGVYVQGNVQLEGAMFRTGAMSEARRNAIPNGKFMEGNFYYASETKRPFGIRTIVLSFEGAIVERGIHMDGRMNVFGRFLTIPEYFEKGFSDHRVLFFQVFTAKKN